MGDEKMCACGHAMSSHTADNTTVDCVGCTGPFCAVNVRGQAWTVSDVQAIIESEDSYDAAEIVFSLIFAAAVPVVQTDDGQPSILERVTAALATDEQAVIKVAAAQQILIDAGYSGGGNQS